MSWLTPWALVTLGYHLLSRLAYVIGVGVSLTRQDREQYFTRTAGVEAGFARFRRFSAWLMNNDAASFVLAALVTRQTLPARYLTLPFQAAGVLLIAAGLGIKLWAAARLGARAYHWENFFTNAKPEPLAKPGPYRFLNNPMYTLGYLHAYGFALLMGSLPCLAFAVFDQVAILGFHHWVEKPHWERLTRAAGHPTAP